MDTSVSVNKLANFKSINQPYIPHPELVLETQPKSDTADKIRSLAAKLVLDGLGQDVQMLAIVSAAKGEGRTHLCANLGLALAQQGKNVLLIDADIRTPRLHKVFSASGEKGLADAVLMPENSEACLCLLSPCLALLPAGHIKYPPQQLLLDGRFSQVLARMRQQFEIILVDTSPMLHQIDAQCLTANADQVLLVARQHHSSIADIRAVELQIRNSGASIIGVVLKHF